MLFLLTAPFLSKAQGVSAEGRGSMIGIKSGIPYWAIATFDLGVKVYPVRHWTPESEAGLSPFSGKNNDGSYGRLLKYLCLHLELRYWFCGVFNGCFLGVHTLYLLYNIADIKRLGTEDECHQGWDARAGISYEYSWLLSHHWNLEVVVGMGYLYLKSDKYPCANCGRRQEEIKKHYFGPTRAAINLIYQF